MGNTPTQSQEEAPFNQVGFFILEKFWIFFLDL